MNPGPGPTLSILIVSYNTADHLQACLASIRRFPPREVYEVLVVDNASEDGSAEMVAGQFPEVSLLRSPTNEGYGAAVNHGVQHTKGAVLLFLNPDVEVSEGSLQALLDFGRAHPRAGVIGPRLLLSNGEPQASARRFASLTLTLVEGLRLHLLLPSRLRSRLMLGTYFPQDRDLTVPWISGAVHMVPRAVWDAVGPLTEATFCGFDDYDYCYRATQAGFEVWLCGSVEMTHHCSVAVRQRWVSWDVEQLAIHNTYVVLQSHWPRWRVRAHCAAEIITWLVEALRHALVPRTGTEALGEPYGQRLRRRLTLFYGLLTGREKPRVRYQPPNRN